MNADWFTTAVRTGERVRLNFNNTDTIKFGGVTRTPLDRKQGWWCSDTATIYFDNVRVPKNYLIGEENQGFKVVMVNFNSERMECQRDGGKHQGYVWRMLQNGLEREKPLVEDWLIIK